MPLRIAFDIGGVLSKYPDQFRVLVNKLQAPGRTGVVLAVAENPIK